MNDPQSAGIELERIDRDFFARDAQEQQEFLTKTWCNHCQAADLGMDEPVEYECRGLITIEGRCLRCRQPVYTELTDESF